MCANSENHDRFLSLFTALIESSSRHTTEHVTREIICLRFVVLSETELKTKLFLTFGFVYHPLKITLATQWNILLHKCLAIIGYLLWWFMNILDMLGCLHNCCNLSSTRLDFVLKHATNIIKSNSPHEKSNWSVCFKSFLLICGQMFLLCFFPD